MKQKLTVDTRLGHVITARWVLRMILWKMCRILNNVQLYTKLGEVKTQFIFSVLKL